VPDTQYSIEQLLRDTWKRPLDLVFLRGPTTNAMAFKITTGEILVSMITLALFLLMNVECQMSNRLSRTILILRFRAHASELI